MPKSILQHAYGNLRRRNTPPPPRCQRPGSASSTQQETVQAVLRSLAEATLFAFRRMPDKLSRALSRHGISPEVRHNVLDIFKGLLETISAYMEGRFAMAEESMNEERTEELHTEGTENEGAAPAKASPGEQTQAAESEHPVSAPAEESAAPPPDDLPSSLSVPESFDDASLKDVFTPQEAVQPEVENDQAAPEDVSREEPPQDAEQTNAACEVPPQQEPPHVERGPEAPSEEPPPPEEVHQGMGPGACCAPEAAEKITAAVTDFREKLLGEIAALPEKVAQAVRSEIHSASNEHLEAINVSLASLNEALGALRNRDLPAAVKAAFERMWPDFDLKEVLQRIEEHLGVLQREGA